MKKQKPIRAFFLGALFLSVLGLAAEARAELPLSWVRSAAVEGNSLDSEAARDFDVYLESVDQLETALASSDDFASGDFDEGGQAKRSRARKARRSDLKPRRKGWGLQSVKLELGVEASGKLGLVGVGGESAVELIWSRRKNAKPVTEGPTGFAALSSSEPVGAEAGQSPGEFGDEPALSLGSDASDAELDATVNDAAALLGRGGRVRGLDRFRRALRSKLLEARPLIAELAAAPESWDWAPYKVQLQLNVEAEGNIAPAVAAGVVSRLRIEWALRRSKTPLLAASPRLVPLERFVRGLSAVEPLARRERFRLNAVKAGVGLGGELELGAVEAKGGVLFSVFLRRALVRPMVLVGLESSPPDRVSQTWLRALDKGARIAGGVTERAIRYVERRERRGRKPRFELKAVEVEIEVSAEGGAILASGSAKSAVELFFYDGIPGGVL
jgi:hypothetical protein